MDMPLLLQKIVRTEYFTAMTQASDERRDSQMVVNMLPQHRVGGNCNDSFPIWHKGSSQTDLDTKRSNNEEIFA